MVEAKIKELSEEFLNDTTWDSINIEKAVISHSFTVSKWINKWMGFKRILDKVQKEFDEKWQARYLYYRMDFDIQLKLDEIKLLIERDTELAELKEKRQNVISIIEYIEKALKNLEGQRWDMKNAIELMKFKAGMI